MLRKMICRQDSVQGLRKMSQVAQLNLRLERGDSSPSFIFAAIQRAEPDQDYAYKMTEVTGSTSGCDPQEDALVRGIATISCLEQKRVSHEVAVSRPDV